MFDNIEIAENDPVFCVFENFKADQNPRKINLSVGAYRDEFENPVIFKAVKLAEKLISENKEYTQITGISQFNNLAAELIFGQKNINTNHFFTCQTVSGAGALFLGAQFLAKFLPHKIIYYSQPTWVNHHFIFEQAGLEMRSYRYYDEKTRGIDEDGFLEDVRAMPEGSAILLQVCGHNPTGLDPSEELWTKIFEHLKALPFFDMAYHGFASGDIEKDTFPIRQFVGTTRKDALVAQSRPVPEIFRIFRISGFSGLAQSFAKNMGLYAERVGTLSVISAAGNAKAAGSQIRQLVSATYLNPPCHGAKIVKTILGDCDLKKIWLDELHDMSNRIKEMRIALKANLEKRGSKKCWSHIIKQTGMFCYSGLNLGQVQELREKYSIYMPNDGRINMSGVNPKGLFRGPRPIAGKQKFTLVQRKVSASLFYKGSPLVSVASSFVTRLQRSTFRLFRINTMFQSAAACTTMFFQPQQQQLQEFGLCAELNPTRVFDDATITATTSDGSIAACGSAPVFRPRHVPGLSILPSPSPSTKSIASEQEQQQQTAHDERAMNSSNNILNEPNAAFNNSYLYDFNTTSDFNDIDNLMQCDISSLDNFIHHDSSSSPTTSTSTSTTHSLTDLEPIDEFFPELTHNNKYPRKSSTSSSTNSTENISEYRQKRDKNNISSQKSRAKREAKVRETYAEKERLERRNGDLKAMVRSLEEQVADYKKYGYDVH
ncbi:unnamed protein product [Caenorhabditis angaria]|uniref:Aspartate aminotransferase n=1 Tax=Caenorhabditis angaria TaxID=860376 RepID=A0A9P1IIX0_9PELO|nr:unnamed protein product [Caenorhabditis angaria]